MEYVNNKLTDAYQWTGEALGIATYDREEFNTLPELVKYTVLGNEVKPCYFQDGTIYAYLFNGQASIHQEDYDSTIAKVQKVPVAFEVHHGTKYYLGGIDDTTGIGTFALGSASPSICASGVVNALGMYVQEDLYTNSATYWGDKLSQTNEWQNCKMYGGNTIPLLVDYSTKKAYVPEEFVFCCAKMIANEGGDWDFYKNYNNSRVHPFTEWEDDTTRYRVSSNNGKNIVVYAVSGSVQGQKVIYACSNEVGAQLKLDTWDKATSYQYPPQYFTIDENTITKDGHTVYLEQFEQTFGIVPLSVGEENGDLPLACFYGTNHVDGLPDFYTFIPNATATDMNKIKDFVAPSQLNLLLANDMGVWKGNAISVTTANADNSTRDAFWYPIAIPYNFVDTPSIDFDPNSFYDTTQTPLGDPVNQIWNGGDSTTYTEENYNYITNNIYGPTNYYYYTINKKPSGDDDVNMPDYNTGKGPTMPDVDPPTDDSDSGIGGVYLPSRSELAELNYWLYNDEVSFDKLLQYFGHPSDAIVGLHQIYVPQSAMTKSTSKLAIQCGYLTAKTRGGDDLTAYKLEKRNCKMYMGHANIQEYFGNVFDYAPYTSLQLFLPWVGFVTLPISKVMRGDVECICNVDIVTGAFLYQINVTRDGKKVEIASYGGCMASQYPVTSGSYSNILGGIIGAVGGALGHSSIKGAIGGAIVGGVSKALDQSVNTSGGYGGSTGALGRKAPYIVVERTIPNMASDYNLYTGNPYNKPVSLGTCSGYTVIDNVRLNTNNMLYEDIVEVENLLRSGVVL